VSRGRPRGQAPTEVAGRAPRRVWVVGCSGAGKTTLARAAARRLGVAHLELDEVFWDAGWQHRDVDEALAILRAWLDSEGRDGWTADGNWTSRGHGLQELADTIVWLDPPRRVVMWRVVTRTLRRGVARVELWHGNREDLASLLRRDPERNIVLWSWVHFDRYREQNGALAARDPRVVRLASARDARAWLGSLRPVPREPPGGGVPADGLTNGPGEGRG
jgi:adenylate kinase family enzyme